MISETVRHSTRVAAGMTFGIVLLKALGIVQWFWWWDALPIERLLASMYTILKKGV